MLIKSSKQLIPIGLLWLSCFWTSSLCAQQNENYRWEKMDTEPFRGKQDDIFFLNRNLGWYVNGSGLIYKTIDGGIKWDLLFEKKGSFFRTVLFISEDIGFIGTVGVGYFPNVRDSTPLYRTDDGGLTWSPISYTGPVVSGLCGMDIIHELFINHGRTDTINHIYAVGRVGGPGRFMVSHDNGITWNSSDLSNHCGMLFDIKMLDKNLGFACASTSEQLQNSHASILRTVNGGKDWEQVYESSRNYETTWKLAFPSENVAYATVQNYQTNRIDGTQRIIKSTDGGKNWIELKLVENHKAKPFGIGFINDSLGYVGTMTQAYETYDGGKSWNPINMGKACNKIRIYRDEKGVYGHSIGVGAFKLHH